MENSSEEEYLTSIPTLEHVASVNLLKIYWRQPEIENLIKHLYHDIPGFTLCPAIGLGKNNNSFVNRNKKMVTAQAIKIFAELIKMMDGVLETLPSSILMKLLDTVLLTGCEIFNWLSVHNMIYGSKLKRFISQLQPINFVDYLDCIVWNRYGFIDYKSTAKLLCNKPNIADIYKYVIACNYCLIEQINLLSPTNLNTIVQTHHEFVAQFPMVGLFTPMLNYCLAKLNPHLPNLQCKSHAFLRLLTMQNTECTVNVHLRQSYDVPVLYLWNSFNNKIKSEHSISFADHKCDFLMMQFITMNTKLELKADSKLLCSRNQFFFENSFLGSYKHFFACLKEENVVGTLHYLIMCLSSYEDNLQFEYVNSRSQQIALIMNYLVNVNGYNFSEKQQKRLNNYCDYRLNKYKIMFVALWNRLPDHIKTDLCVFRLSEFPLPSTSLTPLMIRSCIPLTIPVVMLWIFKLKSANFDIITSLIHFVPDNCKHLWLSKKWVHFKSAEYIMCDNIELFHKFISFFFETDDEIKEFKVEFFFTAFKYIVTQSMDNVSLNATDNLNKFIEYFANLLPTEEIDNQKINFLFDNIVLNNMLGSYAINDAKKLDNYFMWCCSIKNEHELNRFKTNIFKCEKFNDKLVKYLCNIFVTDDKYTTINYKSINVIFDWFASGDKTNLITLKTDFYKSNARDDDDNVSCIAKLLSRIEQYDNNLLALKRFMNWCFPDVSCKDSKIRKFSTEILANNNNLIYLLDILVSTERYIQADEIVKWYCYTFDLDVYRFKSELTLIGIDCSKLSLKLGSVYLNSF